MWQQTRTATAAKNYSEFLDQYRIQSLVKRYSDYIRFPICMDMTKSRKKEDSDEYEDYIENVTLNSMVPLWHKNKNEISEEEYNSFYIGQVRRLYRSVVPYARPERGYDHL